MFFHVFLERTQLGFSIASGGPERLRKRNKKRRSRGTPSKVHHSCTYFAHKGFQIDASCNQSAKDFEMGRDRTER